MDGCGGPYGVGVRAKESADAGAAMERTAAVLSRVLPAAEEMGVTLLVETTGLFCRTADLRTLLERFACDNLGALWQMSAAYFGAGESAEAGSSTVAGSVTASASPCVSWGLPKFPITPVK